MRRAAFLLALVFPAVLSAEDPIGAQEFERLVAGKTLYYAFAGQRYGGEEYLADRRVRWSFDDGRCIDGYWYEDQGNICFVYEGEPMPQCWVFFQRGGRLIAQFANNPEYEELYAVEESDEPLLCYGPDVGV